MNIATLVAFKEELEKISVSQSWVTSRVSSAVNRGASDSRVYDFINRMGIKQLKNMHTGNLSKSRLRDLAGKAVSTAEKRLGARRINKATGRE